MPVCCIRCICITAASVHCFLFSGATFSKALGQMIQQGILTQEEALQALLQFDKVHARTNSLATLCSLACVCMVCLLRAVTEHTICPIAVLRTLLCLCPFC